MKSWRDTLSIHPAAELLPPMSDNEVRVLGRDIKAHGGLTSPIVLWRAHPKGQAQLLDGRNRLDAIEAMTGRVVKIVREPIISGGFSDWLIIKAGEHKWGNVIELNEATDPSAYVISANIHRRHLTAEQKRKVIANLILAHPDKSDRQIAEMIRVSHHTVASVRDEMEGRGQIAHVETRTDAKGRKQPAKKARPANASSKQPKNTTEPDTTTTPPAVFSEATDAESPGEEIARDDIGPNSSSAEIAELRNAKWLLEIEITRLESEIEEARARRKPKLARKGEKRSCSFCCKSQDEVSTLIVDYDGGWAAICAACVDMCVRVIAQCKAAATALPADDGLDIRPALRRVS
jgi:hypothetical protein